MTPKPFFSSYLTLGCTLGCTTVTFVAFESSYIVLQIYVKDFWKKIVLVLRKNSDIFQLFENLSFFSTNFRVNFFFDTDTINPIFVLPVNWATFFTLGVGGVFLKKLVKKIILWRLLWNFLWAKSKDRFFGHIKSFFRPRHPKKKLLLITWATFLISRLITFCGKI